MDTMENKNLQEKENKAFDEMRRAGKNLQESRQNNDVDTPRSSRLWVWLGVIVLIFIILYWLFAIGTFVELTNWYNC